MELSNKDCLILNHFKTNQSLYYSIIRYLLNIIKNILNDEMTL